MELLLGLEPGTGDLVQGESDHVSMLKDLGAAVAPSNVHVIVEVSSGGGRQEDERS